MFGRPTKKGFISTAAAAFTCLIATSADAQDGQHFGDWHMKCQSTDPTNCAIVQNIKVRDSQRRLLQVTVGNLGPNKEMIAFITTPLGVYLRGGLGFKVDQNQGVRVDFEICIDRGCQVGVALTPELINRMKAGQYAYVAFQDTVGQLIEVPVSLTGFTAGFNALPRR